MDTDHDAVTYGLVTGTLSLLILLVGLGGLALGIPWAWVAFPVGYGGVLPLTIGLLRRRSAAADRSSEPSPTDSGPLATLRERYARGEIDEGEFERRVEGLLETES
ncbi:SHOCT domain-containing protein [Halomicroarcula sp. GCM10025709]|uniref:SHOCT domain-containing protein n=1 Tax=Haloarcula TaxID=2237 RepID=UPI0024C440C3|nr:SHOCT domain-containing protein [Halomicroarcula sp. YJ-61-S]